MPQPNNDMQVFKKMADHLYAGAIADILDEMGFRHQVIDPKLGIRPLHPGMVAVGRAWTLVNDYDDRTEDPYEKAIEAMDMMQAGQLLLATGTSRLDTGIFGELSATRIRRKGGVGAVINGFSRDGRKILDMNFPLFCQGISPLDTTGRVRVVDYGVPVKLGDTEVCSGQILFADYDGLVVIPAEAEEEVIDKALERAEVETRVRQELEAGASMDEVWKKHHVL